MSDSEHESVTQRLLKKHVPVTFAALSHGKITVTHGLSWLAAILENLSCVLYNICSFKSPMSCLIVGIPDQTAEDYENQDMKLKHI